jgi:hypothetical protein
MPPNFIQKNSLIFLLGSVLIFGTTLVSLFIAFDGIAQQPNRTTQRTKVSQTPVLTLKPSSPPAICQLKQRDFETGVASPQWSPMAYSESDTSWLRGLQDIRTQTSACWIEMPVLFTQPSLTSTTVTTTQQSTPTLTSFTYGVHAARALGYHVFVTPLLTVGGPQPWSGAIAFATFQQEQQWFEGYWQALKPYAVAAAQAGVEQLALGTEYEWLQKFAPDTLWNELIAHLRSVFPGTLTYDMNWTTLQSPPRAWMRNADLKMIGISAYLPIIDTPERIDPKQIPVLWKNTVKSALDSFAMKLGKPIFISEIGYRNSADALYHSWESTSTAPPDPQEQAAACDAALANVIPDPHIAGIFFWGWDNVGAFRLSGQPAVAALDRWYASLQA